MITRLIMFVAALYSCVPAYAEPLDPARTLYLEGAVGRSTMPPLLNKADALLKAASGEDGNIEDVNIIISSPGGEVISGISFVNKMRAMRAQGITINCYVLDMAASMAFQIFTQCDNRAALETSFLLWHGVRVGIDGPITAEVADAVREDLTHMNEMVMHQLRSTLSLSEEKITHHFLRETLFSGGELHAVDHKFMRLITAPADIYDVLNDPKITRTGKSMEGLFGGGSAPVKPTQRLELIWEKYRYMLGE